MEVKDLVRRLDKSSQLNLLPEWQKAYFKSELLSENESFLLDYIVNSKKLIFESIKNLSKLVDCLNEDEFNKLLVSSDLFSKFLKKIELTSYLDKLKKSGSIVQSVKEFFCLIENEDTVDAFIYGDYHGQENRFFELLDYQVYIKEQLYSFLEEDVILGRALVHMPTGTGKTKTTMHLITQYFQNNMDKKGVIIWIAHTNILLEQAQETLQNVWFHHGEGVLPIYRLYSGIENDYIKMAKTGGVVFCNISSLISLSKREPQIFESIREKICMIVFDEAHKSLAPETRKLMEELMRKKANYSNRFLIGLTATPGRSASNIEENNELAEFFEKRIITIDSNTIERFTRSDFDYENYFSNDRKVIKYFQDRKILARLSREIIDYEKSSEYISELEKTKRKTKVDGDYNSDVIELVSMNINRNKSIIKRLIMLSEKNIPTIFFACSVEHGKFISSLLRANGIKTSEVYGETNSLQRTHEISNFKNGECNILINCSVLTTGFDATNIRCVFISRPTKSIVLYSQMMGRGLRGPKMGGNIDCLLIDLQDNLDRFSDEEEAFSYFEDYWR